MKTFLIGLVLLMIVAPNYAQKYGNIWQFGNGKGLDFNSCTPELISGANAGFEGCSSISDANGDLLFYTNSAKIWDKSHNMMLNGDLNSGGETLSQVIIIPKPLSPDLYYVITTKIQASGNLSLQYHIVDVSLNAGLGEVTSKNNVLSTVNITEQVCATHHANGTDIWLMTHEYGTNSFLAFEVTATGISSSPVISNVGSAHTACNSNINARGEIKFSPDGSRLAFNGNGIGGNDAANLLMICDFDVSNGQVSNAIDLPFSRGEFGLSFSPDNSKLYGTTGKVFAFTINDRNYLYQFDLSSDIPATIIASKQIVDSVSLDDTYGSLKIGPDGKIYVRSNNSSYLGIINAPNESVSSCNYVKNGFYIGSSGSSQCGLNNYIEYEKYCSDLSISSFDQVELTVSPNPFSDQITLSLDEPLQNALLTIRDCNGNIAREITNISGTTFTLERGNLSAGIYLLTLIANEKVVVLKRIVVVD